MKLFQKLYYFFCKILVFNSCTGEILALSSFSPKLFSLNEPQCLDYIIVSYTYPAKCILVPPATFNLEVNQGLLPRLPLVILF